VCFFLVSCCLVRSSSLVFILLLVVYMLCIWLLLFWLIFFCFFMQESAYELLALLEFRCVFFRS